MGALDTAKEILRMTVTSTLSREVIALLKNKAELLAEQVAALETENKDLKQKVANLETETERLRPKSDELDETSMQFLKLLASHSGLQIDIIARTLHLSEVKAQYHCDVLMKAGLITTGNIVFVGAEEYSLTAKGRAFLANKGLI